MLVVIDVTGLPWARSYYTMFPFEPSRKIQDDMVFAQSKKEFLEHPTLVSVMKVMLKAAGKGETEIFLVAHGTEKGLVMKISPQIPLSAEVSVVKMLPVAAEAFDLFDASASSPKDKSTLSAWARLEAKLESNGDDSLVDGIAKRIVADALSSAQNDVAAACTQLQSQIKDLFLNKPNGMVHLFKTTERGLREAASLTKDIQGAGFTRIELRACNVGSGPGIEALRSFFNVTRFMAPTVHTFYVAVHAPDATSVQLEQLAKRAGPRWRKFSTDPSLVPLEKSRLPRFARPYFDPPQVELPGLLVFLLSVTRIETPRYASEARRLNASVIGPWVKKYIHSSAVYGSGPFWVGGLDSPTPNGEPYTLPQDPNYRSLIALATVNGVER
jgi:hypothetical protein